MSHQLNLPQVDSNQVVEPSQRRSMETGLNTYVNKVFLFFVFNTFAMLKTCFRVAIMGYCDVIMGYCDVIMGYCDVIMGYRM